MTSITWKRLDVVDELRGFAILSVIWHHFTRDLLVPEPRSWSEILLDLTNLSNTGVHLFFVISGFLIGGILIDQRSSRRYFSTFIGRRAFRILPLYILYLLIFESGRSLHESGALSLPLMFEHAASRLSLATFTQNLGELTSHHPSGASFTWSLAIEEQFYLVVPLLVWLLPDRVLAALLTVAVLATPFLRRLLGYPDAYYLIPGNLDFLSLGILAALASRKGLRTYLESARLLRFSLLLVSLFLFGLLTAGQGRVPFHYSLLAFAYTGLLLHRISAQPAERPGLVRRVLLWAGVRCYGLYIFHMPVLFLAFALLRGQAVDYPHPVELVDWSTMLLALGIIFLLAHLSYRHIEEPLIRHATARFRYRDDVKPGD